MNLSNISKSLLIALPMLALGACSSTAQIDTESETQEVAAQVIEPVVEETVEAEVIQPLTTEELMVQQYGEDILKHRVNFDFNQSMIKPEFTSILLAHAAYLKDHSDKLITVEGYADEKGTPEYNIALGERRAIAVATYLENMGVGSSQINTMSYGEEKPVNPEHNESAWLQNRRVELVF